MKIIKTTSETVSIASYINHNKTKETNQTKVQQEKRKKWYISVKSLSRLRWKGSYNFLSS